MTAGFLAGNPEKRHTLSHVAGLPEGASVEGRWADHMLTTLKSLHVNGQMSAWAVTE